MAKEVKCKECGSPYVVNKTFKLCHYHNNIRLHGQPYRPSKPPQKKKKNNPNNDFREQMRASDGKLTCEGCGVRRKHLDVSHLIPVSIRKDLEESDKNRQMLCRKCHQIWEHDKIKSKTLFCYEKNLLLVKELDILYFNRNYLDG